MIRHPILTLALVIAAVVNGTLRAQTTVATTGTRAAGPDLATPQKVAEAYFRALADEDGKLYLASVDMQDKAVAEVNAALAATLDASHHYRAAVKTKFGDVAPELLPNTQANPLNKALQESMAQALVTVDKDRATLTPSLPHNAGEGDWGVMFQMTLVRTDGQWRVKLQDSAELYLMQFQRGAQLQAQQQMVRAAATQVIATEIEQGKYASAEAAHQVLQQRSSEALKKLEAQWAAQKNAATSHPATQTQP